MVPPQPQGRRHRLQKLFAPLLTAAVVAGVIWMYQRGLDLRDLPGPAGSQLVWSLSKGEAELGWSSRLGLWLLPLAGGDPVLAARMLCTGAAGLAAVGAALAARAGENARRLFGLTAAK